MYTANKQYKDRDAAWRCQDDVIFISAEGTKKRKNQHGHLKDRVEAAEFTAELCRFFPLLAGSPT